MEDEELLNLILEKLYERRFETEVVHVAATLANMEVFARKNQLRRVIGDLTNNGFIIASVYDEDYQAALTPEGVQYCEDSLMLG